MKEKINVKRVYNLVDANGNGLQLRLGLIQGCKDGLPVPDLYGWRWSFEGKKIPMPVRSCTWFNGFPEPIMLDWLKENGWALRSCVNMSTGRAVVYELPFVDNISKGNEMETLGTDQFPARSDIDKAIFDRVISSLVKEGLKASACRVYRYAHGGTLRNALYAVNEICDKT